MKSGSITMRSLTEAEAGDLVIDIGAYEVTIEQPDGEVMSDSGRFVTVLRRRSDGNLEIILDLAVRPRPCRDRVGAELSR